MSNKPLKICSTSNVPTIYSQERVKIIKNNNMKHWQECRATEPLKHCTWECEIMPSFWKTTCLFVIKLKGHFPKDPTISLVIYPEEMKTQVRTKTCPQVLITASFVIPKTGRTICGLAIQWHFLSNKEQNTDIPSNIIKSQSIMLNEINPSQSSTQHLVPLSNVFRNKVNLSVVAEVRSMGSWDGAWEEILHRCTRELSEVMEMFDILFEVLITWMYPLIKTRWNVYLK